jgi:hypothetical protein
MDEAENVCCALSASNSEALQTRIRCMRAAASLNRSHQTAKRSVTRVNDNPAQRCNPSLTHPPD